MTCSLLKSGNQFAAEVGNILDHTPPYYIPVAESRLVYPDAAGVRDIVLDGAGPRGFVSSYYPCRDGNPATMTNAGDDFTLCIYLTHQLQYPLRSEERRVGKECR